MIAAKNTKEAVMSKKHHYVHVRIDAETNEILKRLAEKNERSLAAQARLFVAEGIAKEKENNNGR